MYNEVTRENKTRRRAKMTRLYNMWFNFKSNLMNKRGQGMVEYVLIIAFIAIVVMLAITPLGTAIAEKFTQVTAKLKPPAQ